MTMSFFMLKHANRSRNLLSTAKKYSSVVEESKRSINSLLTRQSNSMFNYAWTFYVLKEVQCSLKRYYIHFLPANQVRSSNYYRFVSSTRFYQILFNLTHDFRQDCQQEIREVQSYCLPYYSYGRGHVRCQY